MPNEKAIIEEDIRARAEVKVSGIVQGVLFRSALRSQAKLLDVIGWVRNMPDGSLEAVFEGEKGRVRKIIDFCHGGPPGAHVKDVKVEWKRPRHDAAGFEIK